MYEIDVDCEHEDGYMFLSSPELPGFLILVYEGEDKISLVQECIYLLYTIAKEDKEEINTEWANTYLTNPGLQDIECQEDIRLNIRRRTSNT